MKSVGLIFWLSEKAKEFQVLLEEDYELPTYAVFIVIAITTIVVGLALGGVSCLSLLTSLFCLSVHYSVRMHSGGSNMQYCTSFLDIISRFCVSLPIYLPFIISYMYIVRFSSVKSCQIYFLFY